MISETYINISIIIPVFNMEDTIEQTLKSIINQEYKNLELIVIDGGSTDNTVKVINRYIDYIDYFVSEMDDGQYDAINKGLNIATGEIVSWLNADDVYFPWTFRIINSVFSNDKTINWICGIPSFLDASGLYSYSYSRVGAKPQKYIERGYFSEGIYGYLQQESMFFKRDLWLLSGGLSTKYNLAADYDLWTKMARYSKLIGIDIILAGFRITKLSRSKLNHYSYYKEVQVIRGNLSNNHPLTIKNKILNNLRRLLIWRKQDIIFYNYRKQTWSRKSLLRPLSNLSMFDLLKLYNINK